MTKIDTSGSVPHPSWKLQNGDPFDIPWKHLDPFTQGFIEAALRELLDPTKRGWKWEPAFNGYIRPDYHPNGSGAAWTDFPSDVDADEAWVVDHDCDGPPAFSSLAPETLARFMEDCRWYRPTDWPDAVPAVAGRKYWHSRNLRLYLADDGRVRITSPRDGSEPGGGE